ncbi:MAG: dockerin type I repeat-containing protein [Planctomycetota bacterium]
MKVTPTTRALALIALLLVATPASGFIRGDVDGGGSVDIGDAVVLLNSLFAPQPPQVACADSADTNDDGAVNLADAIYLLAALFQPSAPPIPPPYPSDGIDPTADPLPPCGPLGLLTVATLSQGPVSGDSTPTQEIIVDAVAWSAFWAQHSSDPQPFVDFSTEMVVAIREAFDNAGVTINIDEIEALGATLEIRYTLTLPGVPLSQAEQPHHFVRCPKVIAPPVWVATVIALP